MDGRVGTLVVDGVEFVVIPVAGYSQELSPSEGAPAQSEAERWRGQNDSVDSRELQVPPAPSEVPPAPSEVPPAPSEVPPAPSEARPAPSEVQRASSEIRPALSEAKQRQSRLRKARRAARLTQVQLAKRLGKSQAFVSKAETGKAQVGERYVCDVLDACELPADFGAPERRKKTQDELEAHEIAGLDPETLLLVERGSQRDRELREKYVWWANADLAW
jgi:transcriptional regulator with XRE-family HTH domain